MADPSTYKERIGAALPADLKREAVEMAHEQERTLSGYVRALLRAHIRGEDLDDFDDVRPAA